MTRVRSSTITETRKSHPKASAPGMTVAKMKPPGVMKTSWDTIKDEQVTDELTRKVIFGEKATIGRLALRGGAKVARHEHANEEYCWILSGVLRYELDDRMVELRAGEIIVLPPNVPHAIVALEDTICVDFFAPMRKDWLKGQDQYLRNLH